ncbi:efflux RND transporter periplasmic adaptor subunit [Halospina sp. K52047b]|uniref:efflux RND transporter periplasmic adaptor subunit n=1 Tax=Halospina sp. K52047b TaxID=2614160 RepID=UPI00124AB7C3|nr:efflux RND transporter periplasmic adaptor subunit [Halospina sp. K52047b]KAA8982954.1 efflux RND transporter periplasmic adaptor subunit [Halospina sp. K52047b]
MINRIPRGPVAMAIALVILLVLWLLSGDVRRSASNMEDPYEESEPTISRVEVSERLATPFQPEVVIQGQVEPWRTVVIRSRIAAQLESLEPLGAELAKGDRIARLSEEDREEQLEKARAELERARTDVEAASRLRGADLASQSEYLARRAEMAAAGAELEQARIALDDLTPEAPFDGSINSHEAEIGDELQPGDPLAELVQTRRLKVSGRVPQQKAGQLANGQSVRVELLDGRELSGNLSFIANSAHPETRSFRIEAAVPNPDHWRVAGSSATLRIGLAPELATRLSPAHLRLNDAGRLGVRHVSADNEVVFTPVRLLSTDDDGAWVTGLPLRTRLITRGAGFVREGEQVTPVAAGGNGD